MKLYNLLFCLGAFFVFRTIAAPSLACAAPILQTTVESTPLLLPTPALPTAPSHLPQPRALQHEIWWTVLSVVVIDIGFFLWYARQWRKTDRQDPDDRQALQKLLRPIFYQETKPKRRPEPIEKHKHEVILHANKKRQAILA